MLTDFTISESGQKCVVVYSDESKLDTSAADLRPICRSGIKAIAVYGPRFPNLPDAGMYDDSLTVTFNPMAIDYQRFILHDLRQVVHEFRAYRANVVLDEDLDIEDYERNLKAQRETGRDTDGRDGISRIVPACYFDSQLCQRALGMTLDLARRRLSSSVEALEDLGDGLLVIGTSAPVNRDALENLEQQIRSALRRDV